MHAAQGDAAVCMQVEALAAVNYVVRLLPLVQVIFVWILFHEGPINVSQPVAVGVVIWTLFAVIPTLHTIRQRHYKNWVEGGRPLYAPPTCMQADFTGFLAA